MPDPLTIGRQVTVGSKQDLFDQARRIEREETYRYRRGRDIAERAYYDARTALSDMVDPDLLFSKAADSVGARSRRSLASLRSSLGARGLNPNSGSARGALSRIIGQQEGALVGAKRDIALANQQQRQVNAGVNFANAMNLAGLINAPVSGIRYEAAQDIFEGNLAERGIDAQLRSNRRSSRNNLIGSVVGGGLAAAAGLI